MTIEAVAMATQALGLNETYTATAHVTIRHHIDLDDIEAHSLEAACEIAKNWAHEITFDGECPEGDEVVFIRADKDAWGDEIELDCRADGEPFSWEAVRIVKLLAVAKTELELENLVRMARVACTVPSIEQQLRDLEITSCTP